MSAARTRAESYAQLSDRERIYHAYLFADKYHDGQTDKAERPYIEHVSRVAQMVSDSGAPTTAVIAAYLHDTVEDTDARIEDIDTGFGTEVADAVRALTRVKNEPLDKYITRVRDNRFAVIVKRADVIDNSDPDRLALLDDATRERLIGKYARTRDLLGLS